ncbi:hypothetical protein Zm00014a_044241 [Zea mays]|uniref:Uncharacterized protein n=1 Tax=Zea mays TaxID=4577 RepID=A0A3L6G2B3_MAIZE|nr:hypothetical protein Zm00014a_044241 [Zea mays]
MQVVRQILISWAGCLLKEIWWVWLSRPSELFCHPEMSGFSVMLCSLWASLKHLS